MCYFYYELFQIFIIWHFKVDILTPFDMTKLLNENVITMSHESPPTPKLSIFVKHNLSDTYTFTMFNDIFDDRKI